MEQFRTTIRMPAELLKAIEAVRDPEEFPTLSDFVRKAVEKYVRELRRAKIAAECMRLAEGENLVNFAEADLADYAGRMAQAERGEI
ncbi:ribbon-helix-helix domain-containing protein [Neomoorella humiferrea]|uniref:ribbon-helix-helix domain-containing protein n=1 Tax=Neomoorella humiferrea TaxID=676965 RepID=UPI003D8AA833